MSKLIKDLENKKLIHPPKWLSDNTMYLTIMGSYAYGISVEGSDVDVYGFCIPKKEDVFPHLKGEIIGFGRQIQRFDQWQEHHIEDNKKEYDLAVYSIVRYFNLLMDNNPNIIDSIYTPRQCVIHSSAIAEKVRESRDLFLHKGCYHKFRGYAYAQHKKIKSKNPVGKRKEIVEKYGFDTKYASHLVRLLLECQQILEDGTIDLQKDKEYLKAIRRGDVKESQIDDFLEEKDSYLTRLYENSKLQHSPNESKIKTLLLECLEMHYGSLEKAIVNPDKYEQFYLDISNLCQKYA